MMTTSFMDAKYFVLLGLALAFFYAAADEEAVIHTKPDDVPETPGLVRRTASTLDKCAKACLVEKTINCHYFKFVNSSKTCYLSENDNAHVTDFIDKVTHSVPVGASPAPLQIEPKQDDNTSKPEAKEEKEEEIKKTEDVEQLQKSTKKLKSKTNKKWQADASDIKDILSRLAEANRRVHTEMKSNRKNMENISKQLTNVHAGMKHIKSQLGKEKTKIDKLKQEVNDTIKKEVKAVKNITVVKEVNVQKPQKEVKPPKPEQKTTNVSAAAEVDSSKLQTKENQAGGAPVSQKNASVEVPQVDAGGPGGEESDGKEKTDEHESKKEIKKEKKPEQSSTTKKPEGEKPKANRDKRYHNKDMHSNSENGFYNRKYPNNVADNSHSNPMHPNNAGENYFSNNGYPNRGGIKRCPPSYDLHGMNCYKLIRSHLSYEEAKRMCENYKGNIIVINSRAKQNEIEGFAKQNNFYTPEGLWISAMVFDSKTQQYRWDASNTEVLYDNNSSQFDYRKDPQAKRCNIFHINKNGAWDSFACSDRNRSSARFPAICEIYASNFNAN